MERKVKFSLRYKLLLLLIVLPVTTLIAYFFLAVHLFKSDKIAYVFDSNAAMTGSLAAQVSSEVNSLVSGIKPILEGYSSRSAKFDTIANSLFQKDPALDTLAIFQSQDSGPFLETSALKKEASSEAWSHVKNDFLSDLTQEAVVSSLSLRTWETAHHSWIALALLTSKENDPNRMVSIAVVQSKSLLDVFRQSKIYSAYLVEQKGNVLIGPNSDAISSFSKWAFFNEMRKKNIPSGTSEAITPDGKAVLVSFGRTGIGSFSVFSLVQKEVALSAIRILIVKSILFLLALISLATFISVRAAKNLTAKLSELYAATRKISEGDFDIKLKIESSDEIASLGASFNQMGEEVSRLMQETSAKARMEKELETAKTVQETLFPVSDADFGPVKISGFYEPASECGGDWWHHGEIGDKVFVWIGDATGHGAPAALITSAAKSASAIIEKLPPMAPAKVMEFLNHAVYETSKGRMLMTFFIGSFDKKTCEFTYCNASHDPPFLVSKNSSLQKLDDFKPLMATNNPRLGDKATSSYTENTIRLAPGDAVLIYTDGIVEMEGPDNRPWGERKFLKSFASSFLSSKSTQESANKMKQEIAAYRQNTPLKDDITFFIFEYGA